MKERKLRHNEREVRLSDWIALGHPVEEVVTEISNLKRALFEDRSLKDITRDSIYKSIELRDVRLFINKRNQIRWVQSIKPVFGLVWDKG
jgi:hypothetical protein